DARRFVFRPWTRAELHRGFSGATRARKIGGQLLLIVFQNLVGFGPRARVNAAAGHDLHQVDDLVPAGLVKAELQYVARRMAGGEFIDEALFDPGVFGWRFRQRCGQSFARQLRDPLLGISHLMQYDVVVPSSRKVDRTFGSLKIERLSPYTV